MNNQEKGGGRGRFRINVFDAAVLVLALFCVLTIFHKSKTVSVFEQDRASHAYTVAFEICAVRYDVIEDLTVGTVLYTTTGEDRVVLGSMLDEPVIISHTGASPEGAIAVDLAGTLLCHGVLREGALVLPEGYVLRVGDELILNTEVATVTARVISLTEIA